MNNPQTFSTSLHCTLSDLELRSLSGAAIALIPKDESLQLSATLTLGDAVNGELVRLLLPLKLTIRAIFYAKPHSPKPELQLGSVTLQTIADVWQYVPSLTIADPAAIGLLADETYQLGVMVSVGASTIAIPSLMRGYAEGPRLGQEVTSRSPEPKAAVIDLPTSVPAAQIELAKASTANPTYPTSSAKSKGSRQKSK
ncbi:MAG: hypothetical protein KME16_16740 [Scytolyngbya sp. HA4215-MV1]|jgi:hypothetical protein|nr:hypothetical protein [Scytolyngbya sp. HA4215-MV1]